MFVVSCVLGVSVSALAAPSPLLEYKFNETGTTAIDTGSLRFNAVMTSDALGTLIDAHSADGGGVTGQPGDRAYDGTGAAAFGAVTGNKVNAPDNDDIDFLTSFTICGWFKVPPTTNIQGTRLFYKTAGANGYELQTGAYSPANNGQFYLRLYVGTTAATAYYNYTSVADWTFFAVTFDGTLASDNVKYYMGTQTGGVTLKAIATLSKTNTGNSSRTMNIGNTSDHNKAFDGLIDNFRLYGSQTDNTGALSITDLEALRSADLPPPPEYVDASTFGYDPADATAALQAAINTGAKVVYVPNMGTDWIVRPIYLVSNQEIIFAEGVNVIAKRGEFLGLEDCLFSGSEVDNVTLSGTDTTFKMWRSDYTSSPYTAGEWRHGIKLRGCNNVTISGITVKETGGDGIYLGKVTNGRLANTNITLQNVVCDDNHRNALSVITVDGLTVDNCIFRATSGTDPRCGIDFEPNNANESVANIIVTNCIFETNGVHGVLMYMNNLADPRNYSILIENCTFYGNGSDGLAPRYGSDQLIIKDSLFVNNEGYGINNKDSSKGVTVTYSAFWGNSSGVSKGLVTLGTGCLTAVNPIFASTTFGDENYMALAADCPSAITAGASDGGYIGAKPKVSSPRIPGDANEDGSVDVGDLGILAANYGGSGKGWSQGDFNGDGNVDVGDLGILAANYGQGSANASSADFNADHAKAFGTAVDFDTEEATDEVGNSVCGSWGLPLMAGLMLIGLMLVKLEE